jgi:hypothetical protein
MVGSFILALLFAIGHHLFFSHIDTTLAGSPQSQFWVRNAGNAFAHFAVIFLGIAVSTSLIQAVSLSSLSFHRLIFYSAGEPSKSWAFV